MYEKLLLGEDARSVVGRLFIQDCGMRGGYPAHLVAGVLIGDLGIPQRQSDPRFRDAEMWAGRIILVPEERYRDTEQYFAGMGITGTLTGGYEDPRRYGLKVK